MYLGTRNISGIRIIDVIGAEGRTGVRERKGLVEQGGEWLMLV